MRVKQMWKSRRLEANFGSWESPMLRLVPLCLLFLCACPAQEPKPQQDAGIAVPEGPELAPEEEVIQVLPDEWMLGRIGNTDNQALERDVRWNRLQYPEVGSDRRYAVDWERVRATEAGDLPTSQRTLYWAVAKMDLSEGERLFARVDRGYTVYVNGRAQPADIYGSGKHRIPLADEPGEHLIAAQLTGGRGNAKIQLFITGHEIVFNPRDRTYSDLREGDDSPLYLGIPVLNITSQLLGDVQCRVLESEHVEATTTVFPGMGSYTLTQLAFEIRPKAPWGAPETVIPITIEIEAQGLIYRYQHTQEYTVIESTKHYRRSFISPQDGSVQYYGVQPPKNFDAERDYALVLSLHGASVEAIGQARSYSQRDWNYVVAATNRRPFGFDWEEWGHFNALHSLDNAMDRFNIDTTRVYVTGHSMGGHGTWHNGVMMPGRFATLGPSAGWESFYSYGGSQRPSGLFARSRAHSDTLNYLSNIARRGVYVIHADADDNVPVREGRNLVEAARQHTDDVEYHEEPGKGHWWNGDVSEGVDCVDWQPLFDFMEARSLDPFELDFEFISPNAAYAEHHSYVRLRSALSPEADLELRSRQEADRVILETVNVRSMILDGDGLTAKGISEIEVDGEVIPVTTGDIEYGPQTGKRPGVHGPYNEVYRRPFCFIVSDNDRGAAAAVAAHHAGQWNVIGNGQACTLPMSRRQEAIDAGRNTIYVAVSQDQLNLPNDFPFRWDDEGIYYQDQRQRDGAFFSLFEEDGRLSAVLAAPTGKEDLLFEILPYSSRSGFPDFLAWNDRGLVATGFYDSDWRFDTRLTTP